jgi:myo-inositol-1(or 4)-monophosphatase
LTNSYTQRPVGPSSLMPAFAAVVREAGVLARDAFGKPVRTWFKERSSPVSEADIAVDELLRKRLTALMPDAGWLSEETEDAPERLAVSRLFIVDPIDGTRAFLAGRADWAVSAALVENGRPVLAALYAPVSEEFYLAIAGGGATRNNIPLHVTSGEAIAGTRVAGPKGVLDRLAEVAPPFEILPRIHSLALRLARVADGTLDIAFAGRNGADWDLAAADLLVHEAGGVLTTVGGAQPAYNRAIPVHGVLVAAGLARHRALAMLLRDHEAELR